MFPCIGDTLFMVRTQANDENNKQLALAAIRQALRDNAKAAFGPVEAVTLRAEVMARLKSRGWTLPEVKRAYVAACMELLPKDGQ